MTDNETQTLECLVDAYGLESILHELQNICDAKAEHIVSSYNDEATADNWTAAGMDLYAASQRRYVKAVSKR